MNKLKFAVSSILCLGFLASGIAFTACGDEGTHGAEEGTHVTEEGTHGAEEETHTHSYSIEWISDETYHWHAATCEHTDEVSEKAEHSYGNWTVTKQATCTEKGSREKTCVCGKKQTEEIAATGHSYSTEWTSDETYHWHAATCDHTDEISGKAEHTYADGACSVCSKREPITLTADTDFTRLVSDVVTEDEWKTAFDMNSVANFTEKLNNDNGINYCKTVTDTEGYRVVDCSSFTRSVYRKSSDGVISYSSDLEEWTTINFDDYGDSKERVEDSVNWTMSFKCLCADFNDFFAKFTYNSESGAYEFIGRDVCNTTDESSEFYNPDCAGGSDCTHSDMIRTNSILENWNVSYYKAIVKIVDGKLAYVKAYMSSNSASEITFYDYGTTEITVPVSQTNN
jgi:hypothetical protein